MKRGIDNLKPGQLIVIGFSSMMDENFHPGKSSKKKIKKELKNRIKLPAIILKKKYTKDDWPVYNVGFWTRSNTGEMSGMIELKNSCIWRYFVSDTVEEGTPPEWLLKTLENTKDFYIDKKDIFYIKSKNGNPKKDYRFYPFKK